MQVSGRGGVVASGHPAVSAAGIEILERGGNAVDAAVGAFFTAFHAEPLLASAGGAGFAVAVVDGEPVAWDFFANAPGLGRGEAPYTPGPGAFFATEIDFGPARQEFHVGPGSIAIPGALAGLCTAQREAGRLPLAEVLAPARRACAEGTDTLGMGAFAVRLLSPIVRSDPAFERYFHRPDGALIREGDSYHNPELGRFYDALAEAGTEALLYDGALTGLLVDEVAQRGGGVTRDDLGAYRVLREDPVQVGLSDGTRLLLCPPASSGGMLLAYGAALLDGRPAPALGTREDALLLRAVMAETLHARAEILGGDTPRPEHAARLLDPATVAAGRDRLRGLLALGAGPLPPEPSESLGSTTHVSVIDRQGNACSATISNGECSGLVLPGYGVFLNNFLGEADLNPHGFHRWTPGTRLGSSMTPLLALRPDGTVLAVGSGGSNRIRTTLLQVVRDLVVHGLPPAAAVVADRLHYEDDRLYAEAAAQYGPVTAALEAEGLAVARFPTHNMFFGGAHLALRAPDGTVSGVGDPRRSGAAAVERPA